MHKIFQFGFLFVTSDEITSECVQQEFVTSECVQQDSVVHSCAKGHRLCYPINDFMEEILRPDFLR